ncbi:hypothetical protein CEXT_72101 [Caerostris extrusa]|uniref:Uncharacterized protein n=1 Tax=Caerostris extrusa TaxID=172846 RepID=A0AAV4MZ20_CAEEX|nr:hypothetical protein CEXT_72101 [Caerostris extrusa]
MYHNCVLTLNRASYRRKDGRTEGRTDRRKNERTDEKKERKEERRKEGRTDGRKEERTDGMKEGKKERRMEGWKDGRKDRRKEGRIYGRTDGRKERQMEGRKDVRTDGRGATLVSLRIHYKVLKEVENRLSALFPERRLRKKETPSGRNSGNEVMRPFRLFTAGKINFNSQGYVCRKKNSFKCPPRESTSRKKKCEENTSKSPEDQNQFSSSFLQEFLDNFRWGVSFHLCIMRSGSFAWSF